MLIPNDYLYSSPFTSLWIYYIVRSEINLSLQAANIQDCYCWAPTVPGTHLWRPPSMRITLFAAKSKSISRSQAANIQDCYCWAPTITGTHHSGLQVRGKINISLPSCEYSRELLLECAPFGNTLVPESRSPQQRLYALYSAELSPGELI